MDHQERATFFLWVFDSATYTLRRALETAGFDAESAEQGALERFRKNFDRRSFFNDAAKFGERWHPRRCKELFADLVPVLRALSPAMPVAGTLRAELEARVAAIPDSDAPDACAVVDGLLTDFVQPTIIQVSREHWATYRRNVATAARADADRATAESRLSDEIRSFYEFARATAKDNDDVLGALVEEFIRGKIAALVHPLQTSSGGIYGLDHISQIDCIIWDRQGYPPAIEVGPVAIVAPQSVRGVIEIKASFDSRLAEFVERIIRFEAEGSVLQDLCRMGQYPRALGVLVWTSFEFERVEALAGSRVVPLFRRVDEKFISNPRGVQHLLDFLRRSVLFKA